MSDEPAGPDLVALFYRADWTRLRLTARVTGMVDFSVLARLMQSASPLGRSTPLLPPANLGVRRFAGTLRLEPGGHFSVDISEPPAIDEADRLYRMFLSQHGFLSTTGNAPRPAPYPDLLHPSRLLNGFMLERLGDITESAVPGRRTLAVVATPVPGARAGRIARPERINVIADVDAGILLRNEERYEGRTWRETELTNVDFGEPGDPFSAPDRDEPRFADHGSGAFTDFSGPGWTAARTVMNAAGTVLGSVISHAPERNAADPPDPDAAMPPDHEASDDPASSSAAGSDGRADVSDELLFAMYGSGSAIFSGTLHQWTDMAAAAQRAQSSASRHGWGGVGSFADAVGDRVGVVHTVSRVRIGGGGKYRVEQLRRQRADDPRVLTCDGEQLWRELADKVVLSPAAPLKSQLGDMIDTSPLLECHLSSVRETEVGGRRAFALQASWVPGGGSWSLARMALRGGDMVIDAELGIMLRYVERAGGQPVYRSEFRDVTAGRAASDDEEFRARVPPGTRVVRADGTLLDDVLVALPDPVRVAAKAAGSGLKAARGLLDYLNDRRGR